MTANKGITLPASELTAFVARLFVSAGIPARSAEKVAAGLVDAELEGQSSHGVMLVDMYLNRIRNGSVSLQETGIVVSDRDGTVVIDAQNALGHLVGDQAIAIAVERAKRHGAGIVAVRNAFHFGTARRFAIKAADGGCIGIAMCNTRPLMPAPGGAERVVGNNPIAIAVPSDGPIPIVLDMATSEAAMGKIRMAAKAGEAIPSTWAVKADGTPTVDPAEAIAGMLLPSGGPKGFGLALLIDLMCGLLSGGASGDSVQPLYGDPAVPYNSSQLFMAIDVAHFGDSEKLRARAAAQAETIRTGKRTPDVGRLFTPGEPEWRRRAAADGKVTLAPAVIDMLSQMAGEFQVSTAPLLDDHERSIEEVKNAEA
jgi:LDH2 family malate/lactate/ureidoglycolate dehydrogenase